MNYEDCIYDSNIDDREQLLRLLDTIGFDICFSYNIWICDKRIENKHEKKESHTIYFTGITDYYLELVKYYTLVRIKQNKSNSTIIGEVRWISLFLRFLTENFGEIELINTDLNISNQFIKYLNYNYNSEASKCTIWISIKNFYENLKKWSEFPDCNPFEDIPYNPPKKYDYKIIPEEVAKKLDIIFMDERIPLNQRLIYWICRCYPSRISEVCEMKIDSIKPYNGKYVMMIPIRKEDGGYKESEIKPQYLEYVGKQKYIIDLIREQQEVARKLQNDIEAKDLLFTYRGTKFNRFEYRRTGKIIYSETKNIRCFDEKSVNYFLQTICNIFDIRDNDGKIFNITSHQFRHNGITDRLRDGFTVVQIREMVKLKGDAVIIESYNHLNLTPEVMHKKQRKVIEKHNNESRPAYFRGRMLNLEKEVADRILRNVRAHKVPGGLCRDIITNCESKMFACLDCDMHIDDVDDLPYFEEQIILWKEKMINFTAFPLMLENAKYNYSLHLRHANNIKCTIKEVENNA